MYCCCLLQNGQRSSLPALWWVEVRWSFEELVWKGDRVFLILPRVPEWWLVNVACLRTGTVSALLKRTSSNQHIRMISEGSCDTENWSNDPINPEVMWKWKELTGLDIYEGYGQTETPCVLSHIAGTFKGVKIKPGSFGKASPGYDVQVVDEDGSVVPHGQEGDLGIRVKPDRPFSLFTEYTVHLYPERMAECFCGEFYLTSDWGMMDNEGYLWFIGRAYDVILSAGYRIGPFEVENALIEHPAVAESAVVSSPDPVRGDVAQCFLGLPSSRDHKELIQELQTHVKTFTAPYKYPRKIEFVDHLPKTVSGKIRRVELRKKE
uniref:medium-chain acyl-CoA ligase n=1 Tax=Sinocyclocheilus anshuiensis TaxID=1608454 RepID=A0A671P8Z0_9TELE